jgi:hypothetical protein
LFILLLDPPTRSWDISCIEFFDCWRPSYFKCTAVKQLDS